MSVPVLLVTGFLGAGKTTAINALLRAGHGERIAAIVNDFGAINIDAEILSQAAGGLVGLKNGCICCSLQGDLLRTLRLVLAQKPDRIVIEASGAADPRGVIETLLDPALREAIALDAIVCLIDAQDLAQTPERMKDALWLAQARHSDFLLVGKEEGLAPDARERLRAALAGFGKPVFDQQDGPPVAALLGKAEGAATRVAPAGEARAHGFRFVTIDWTSEAPVSMAAFQHALTQILPGLVRAKGFLRFVERPGETHLLQIVGRRIAFSRAEAADDRKGCALVLIGERGEFEEEQAREALAALVASAPGVDFAPFTAR